MIYLLDTDIFTLAHQQRHGLRERIAALVTPDIAAISVITRVEVLRGRLDAIRVAATAPDVLRMQRLLEQSESYLGSFRYIPFDEPAGDLFDRFRAEKRPGKTGRGDLLIACIALANNATLVTRNTKDYANVPGLKLANWAD